MSEVEKFDWCEVTSHLNELIEECRSLGPNGIWGIMTVLYPLKARLDEGERTKELYDAIMAIE